MKVISIKPVFSYIVKNEILQTLGQFAFETGGILGSCEGEVIDCFCFDKGIMNTGNSYNPNVKYLNEILEEWNDNNIKFIGIIHSHMRRKTLSLADLYFAEKLMKSNLIEELIMSLFIIERHEIICYKIC